MTFFTKDTRLRAVKASIRLFIFMCLMLPLIGQGEEIKVMTLNLGAIFPHSIKTRQSIRSFCHSTELKKFDVVLLQEVWLKEYRKLIKDNCSFGYIVDLNESSGLIRKRSTINSPFLKVLSYLFAGVFSRYQTDNGLMILSRHEVLSTDKISYSENGSEKHYMDGEIAVNKGAIGAFIQVGNEKIFVATTHLVSDYPDHEYLGQRQLQLSQLSDWVTKSSGGIKTIIGGDFNISPPSHSKKRYLNTDKLWMVLKKSYFKNSSFAKFEQGDMTTFPGQSDLHDEGQVDHIFSLNGLWAIDSEIETDNIYSDHFAYSVVFSKKKFAVNLSE